MMLRQVLVAVPAWLSGLAFAQMLPAAAIESATQPQRTTVAYVSDLPVAHGRESAGLAPNTPFPGPDRTGVRIAAGRYLGAATLFDAEQRERACLIYQLGNRYYYTAAVTSSGKANEINRRDQDILRQYLPPGAHDVELAHSHPEHIGQLHYEQFPSAADARNAATYDTGFGVLGLTDGRVYLFAQGSGRVLARTSDGAVEIRDARTEDEIGQLTRLADRSPLDAAGERAPDGTFGVRAPEQR